MQYKKWTPEQIAEMYFLKQSKMSSSSLAKKYGRTTAAIDTLNHKLKYYMEHGFDVNRRETSELMEETIKLIKSGNVFNETNPVNKQETDHYTELENAFASFSNSIEKFVLIEVEKRTLETKKEYEKIIKKKDEEYKLLTEAARESNWVESLRRKFGDTPKTF